MNRRTIYEDDAVIVHAASAVDDQVYVTASVTDPDVEPGQVCREVYAHLGAYLNGEGLQVVHERLFGTLDVESALRQARAEGLGATAPAPQAGPLTYIQGRPLWGRGLAGVQVFAVKPASDEDVWTIQEGGQACGRGWMRNGARFLMLHNIHGATGDPALLDGRPAQAGRMFDLALAVLRQENASYRDVVRTWIYLSRLLDWYDEFNPARTQKYSDFGLMRDPSELPNVDRRALPASTGIEGDNPIGAACVMDVLAIVGEPDTRPEVVAMTNVKQLDAFKYGSAFSRGAAIRHPDHTCIQISGTAAIDETGRSVCLGDAGAQMAYTLDNIDALVAPEGASMRDVCQATVFLKRADDYPTYREITAERGLSDMPAVFVEADVCRGDLLFEIDGEAAVTRSC